MTKKNTLSRNHNRFVKRNAHKGPSGCGDKKGRHVMKASYVCFGIVTTFVILWLPYLLNDVTELIIGRF